jgi:hypothetical protein
MGAAAAALASRIVNVVQSSLRRRIVVMDSQPSFAGFADRLFGKPERSASRSLIGSSGAIAVHLAIGLIAATGAAHYQAPPPRPVELELELATVAPAPAPEPLPAPEPPTAVPAAPARPAVSPHAAATPVAAHAGALLTAKPDPAASAREEPVDFASDPNGGVYGSGVVAAAGKGAFGAPGAQATAAAVSSSQGRAATSHGEALTALGDLSEKPRLTEADPCRGFFPSSARDDVADVSLMIVLAKSGRVSSAALLSETSVGQGFGSAGRACILSKKFLPGLDRQGNPAATSTRINIRFRR